MHREKEEQRAMGGHFKPNFGTELIKADPIGRAAFLGLTGKRQPSSMRGKDHVVTLSRLKHLPALVVCR